MAVDKSKVKIFLRKYRDFLVKRENWIIFFVAMILLIFLARVVYDYFQIGISVAEFNIMEVKIKEKELEKMEEYKAGKNALLAEKEQRNYRDLFR